MKNIYSTKLILTKHYQKKYVNQAKLAVKDEYIFDFMELSEQHSERELEESLINNMILINQ